jgi:hypothetical protein
VAMMETYLRANPQHVGLIVDELQTLLKRLKQKAEDT